MATANRTTTPSERSQWSAESRAVEGPQDGWFRRHPWTAAATAVGAMVGAAFWFFPPAKRTEAADRRCQREKAIPDGPPSGRRSMLPARSASGAIVALWSALVATLRFVVKQSRLVDIPGSTISHGNDGLRRAPPTLQSVQPMKGRRAPTSRKPSPPRSWWSLLRQTVSDWQEDRASQLGAALAYYTVFSLAPLLVIVLAIAGWVFGEEAAMGEIRHQLQDFLGDQGAGGVEALVSASRQQSGGVWASVAGVIVLLFGATGVFAQLQDSLNVIWEVEPTAGRGVWGVIHDRFLSFAMVLGIGFLLLVSLVLSTVVSVLTGPLGHLVGGVEIIAEVADIAVSFVVVTLLFALIFKLLPDAHIAWKDVWIGAVATSLLFAIGKYLIGLYLGHSAIASTYGAAASLVIVLLWTYYSAQILFLGAEFTQVYARMYGSRIQPVAEGQPAE